MLNVYGAKNVEKTFEQLTFIIGRQKKGDPALFMRTEDSNIIDTPIKNNWLKEQGYNRQLTLSERFEPPKSLNNFLRQVAYDKHSKFYYAGHRVGKPCSWKVEDVDIVDDMALLTSPVKSGF